MGNQAESGRSSAREAPHFATTRWSVVLAADDASSPQADEALAQLCQTYWYPLYSFVRRRGHRPSEAEDLTQSFFTRFIEQRDYRTARPEKGKFRTFLLICLKRFLANDWHRQNARKRGGQQRIESLDAIEAERRYQLEPVDPETPEVLYQRSWACTVLQSALQKLREQHVAEGKVQHFEQLKVYLTGEPPTHTQAEVARLLEVTEGAVKSAVYRLRKQFARQLRLEIAETVIDPTDVEQELNELFSAFQPRPTRQA